MKKMILEIEVDDDFENGDCDNCPMGCSTGSYNDFLDECPMPVDECPLKSIEELFTLKLDFISNVLFDFSLKVKDKDGLIIPCKKSLIADPSKGAYYLYSTEDNKGTINVWNDDGSFEAFKQEIMYYLLNQWEHYTRMKDELLAKDAIKEKYWMFDTFEQVSNND